MARFIACILILLFPLVPLPGAETSDAAAMQKAAAALREAAAALKESAAALKEAAQALKNAQSSRAPSPEELAAMLRAEEEKEAAAEEAAELKLDPEFVIKVHEGMLNLYPPAQTRDAHAPIGTLNTGEKTFLLKVDSAELRAALKACDGKQTRLGGKLRNKGKYLLALEILAAGAAPTYTRKRGGV
jgi:hypothetical protein